MYRNVFPDNDAVRADLLDYAFEVENFDAHFGRILTAIEKAGQLHNTLVIATSDHGMPFPRCTGQAYDAYSHIPLAIMSPDCFRTTGRTVADFVTFADIAPTIIEAADLEWQATRMTLIFGTSLLDILRRIAPGRSTHPEIMSSLGRNATI